MAHSRVCKDCGTDKPMAEFHLGAARCKLCSNKRITEARHRKRAEYLAAHPRPDRTTKFCRPCGRELPLEAFYRKNERGWLSAYCKECQRRVGTASRLRLGRVGEKCSKLHVSVAWFYAQREKQGNLCAICRTPEIHPVKKGGVARSLAIDHDHRTGKVRGLLCFRCNTALHQLEKHGHGWASAAIEYLKRE